MHHYQLIRVVASVKKYSSRIGLGTVAKTATGRKRRHPSTASATRASAIYGTAVALWFTSAREKSMNPCLRLLACSVLLWSATAGTASAQQFMSPQSPMSPQHQRAQQAEAMQYMKQMQAQASYAARMQHMHSQGMQPQGLHPQGLQPQGMSAQQAAYMQQMQMSPEHAAYMRQMNQMNQMQQMQAQRAGYMQHPGHPGNARQVAFQQPGPAAYVNTNVQGGEEEAGVVGGLSGQPLSENVYVATGYNTIVTGLMNPTWMGNLWGGVTLANHGLGYKSSFASIGGKTRTGEDSFGGRWLLEGRLHTNIDTFGFFTNVGIERVFTIKSAHSDVSLGVWYDGDADELERFGHTYDQVGPTFKIKNRLFQLFVNGYIPVGDTSFISGTDFDIAYKGFDATLRVPLPDLAMYNVTLDLGGYYYATDSAAVGIAGPRSPMAGFGGFRARVNSVLMHGIGVSGELTQDAEFGTTFMVTFSGQLGVNDNYDPLGLDLDMTPRQAHIVRKNSQP